MPWGKALNWKCSCFNLTPRRWIGPLLNQGGRILTRLLFKNRACGTHPNWVGTVRPHPRGSGSLPSLPGGGGGQSRGTQKTMVKFFQPKKEGSEIFFSLAFGRTQTGRGVPPRGVTYRNLQKRLIPTQQRGGGVSSDVRKALPGDCEVSPAFRQCRRGARGRGRPRGCVGGTCRTVGPPGGPRCRRPQEIGLMVLWYNRQCPMVGEMVGFSEKKKNVNAYCLILFLWLWGYDEDFPQHCEEPQDHGILETMYCGGDLRRTQ